MVLQEKMLFAERYELLKLLGRGGFSEVWLAADSLTKLEVAIKIYAPNHGIDEDGLKEFSQELANVYNLNHSNLLKPQHVDNWKGMPYLIMPFCPQGSCHRVIGKISEEDAWKILHDVAAGLAYLHAHEIIHQDIKPDNILIDKNGHYVITDFGISVKSRSTLRKSMNVATNAGTTCYMGPERFSKDPAPIKASDIWSLGATLYELITGDTPFGEIGGGLQKGGAELPTIHAQISNELRLVLTRMLAAEPWQRPTAEQLTAWGGTPQLINVDQVVSSVPEQGKPTIRRSDVTLTPDVNLPLESAVQSSNMSSQDNKKTTQNRTWLIVSGFIVAILIILGTVFLVQSKHARELKLEQEQREKARLEHFEKTYKSECKSFKNHIQMASSMAQTNVSVGFSNLIESVRDMRNIEKLEKDHVNDFALIDDFEPQLHSFMVSFKAQLNLYQHITTDYLTLVEKQHLDKNGSVYKGAFFRKKVIDRMIEEAKKDCAFDITIPEDRIDSSEREEHEEEHGHENIDDDHDEHGHKH